MQFFRKETTISAGVLRVWERLRRNRINCLHKKELQAQLHNKRRKQKILWDKDLYEYQRCMVHHYNDYIALCQLIITRYILIYWVLEIKRILRINSKIYQRGVEDATTKYLNKSFHCFLQRAECFDMLPFILAWHDDLWSEWKLLRLAKNIILHRLLTF